MTHSRRKPHPGAVQPGQLRGRHVALLTAVVCSVVLAAWLTRDPTARMLERRSTLASVEELPGVQADSHLVQVVRLRATGGLEVDLTVKRHVADSVGRYPLVLILGGRRTGQDAVQLLENTRGVVAAAVAYPYSHPRKANVRRLIRDIPRIRQALVDTPPALMLATDYLVQRPDVDSTRVDAIGVSFGVPFTVVAAALDDRVTRLWVVHGTGGTFQPLQHNLRETFPFAPVRYAVAGLVNVITGAPPLAPERWIARTAPRELVMITAENDEMMPLRWVRVLFDAAGEPKELILTPGGHVRSAAEAVRPLVGIVMERITGTAPVAALDREAGPGA
jgi:dienelactone hydrolase